MLHAMHSHCARAFATSLIVALFTACATAPLSEAPSNDTPAQAVPAEALNPDVSQATVQKTICVSGFTASIRPSTSYTNGVKLKLLREQGRPSSAAPEFELDHRVPLALGGSPRSLANLQLQPWEGDDGAKKKDRLERRLQTLVCSGKVGLDEARRAMYFNWQAALPKYVPGP
jgi:hypothetical protein